MFLFSLLLCFIQRSCVSGSSVEMVVDSESLLLAHVAPCSFRPADRQRSANARFRRSASLAGLALTFDAEAAGVQRRPLRGRDVDLQTELLQRPAVDLRHVLTRGRDVCLRHKQTAQVHVDVLKESERHFIGHVRYGLYNTK